MFYDLEMVKALRRVRMGSRLDLSVRCFACIVIMPGVLRAAISSS
jgi:hypothetical protein